MLEVLLLRYRDLRPSINTVDEHNKVVKEKKRVLWGWWKKGSEPMPDPQLYEMSTDILKNSKKREVFIINSGTHELYKAPLYKIYYQIGGGNMLPKDESLCPEYYSQEKLPAWFELGKITKIGQGYNELSNYVFSKSNRRMQNNSSCLSENEIGQVVTDINFLEKNISLWFLNKIEDYGIKNDNYALNISSGIWPTKGKYILHLSDIHFGGNHAFKNPLQKDENIVAKQQLQDILLDDLKSIKVSSDDIALVVVSGDLTWRASPHEFSNASYFLDALKNQFGLSNKQIILVPGNHDIEWIDETGNVDSDAELNYKNFYESFYNVIAEKSFMRINKFRIGEKIVCIAALNSCRMESKENAGFGYIGNEQLDKVQKYLGNNKDIDIVIAMCHHQLLPVNYIEGFKMEQKRVSMMLDAELVLRTLIANKVNAVIHGHQHQPYYTQIRRIIPEYINKEGQRQKLDGTINVIGGGSCGVNQAQINVIGRNTYNLISFKDNNLVIRTRIKSGSGIGFYDEGEIIL